MITDAFGNEFIKNDFYVKMFSQNGINYPILLFCVNTYEDNNPQFLAIDCRDTMNMKVRTITFQVTNIIAPVEIKHLANNKYFKFLIEDERVKQIIRNEKLNML